MKRVVAIDGPAGSGKSTVARKLAERLSLPHIDTGAMYRAVTLKAVRRGIGVDEAETLERLASSCEIELRDARVFLDGFDVTEAIRMPEVDAAVSAVSAHEAVRKEMVRRQRSMVADGAVVEGRDIGTVVLPDADLKVFLTASSEERARRRLEELTARGVQVSIEDVTREIEERDRLDSNRRVSPLRPADDAVRMDTTDRTIEDVIEAIVAALSEKRAD